MAGIHKFDRDPLFVFAARPLAPKREWLAQRTEAPLIRRAIGLAMGEERIHHQPELFALPRHDVHRIVEERARDFRGRFRHEDARFGLALHQERQRPAVIEVSVRKNDRVQRLIANRAKVRERLIAFLFRMHPAVQHETLARRFEIITVRPDLSPAREIDELHRNDE